MANKLPRTLETETSRHHSEEEEDEDADEEVEAELQLKQMAQLIQKYRSTIPDRIKNTFGSLLSAQRPLLPSPSSLLQPQVAPDRNPESTDAGEIAESSEEALLAEEDPETAEKLRVLKHKISSNISVMPTVLKRVNDCISSLDKLDTYDVIAHPALKRKRTR